MIEYKNTILSQEDNSTDFFAYCLENKLYKDAGSNALFQSRMKNLYEDKKVWQGLSACVASFDSKPIGICLLEHRRITNNHHTQQAGIMKLFRRAKDPWQKKYDWHFIHAGFLSFYIKEPYRGQGIASKLLACMEEIQHGYISQQKFSSEISSTMPDNCIVVTARELALKIVGKSRLFYGIECDLTQGNYQENLSDVCRRVVVSENQKKWGDFSPNYSENLKRKAKI